MIDSISMKGKRVFVSGGAGVIGLEMIPLLHERGAKVLVGDLKPRPSSFPAEVIYRQGDLNYLTESELKSFAPDIFIHLAATFERTTESYSFWEENFWHNVRLSHHLMSVTIDLPSLKRVVFASSYLIYEPALYQFDTPQERAVSLKETDPVLPRNLIGMSKLAHEIELRFLNEYRSEAFTTVCARIYRGYGRNSRDVISRWVRSLLNKEQITVYRPEGMFDYIYARDSADGLIRLANADLVNGIINLGTGKARRVQDVVDILRKHFPDMQAAYEDSDIKFEASQADMSGYRDAIGWNPEYTLEKAISEIIEHEKAKQSVRLQPTPDFGHVLVSSASRKVPLIRAVQEAARKLHPEIKVIAGDADENALAVHVADSFWKMPYTVDEKLESIFAECRLRNTRIIVPTRDGELSFWARHKRRFAEAGIDVIVSPEPAIQVCLDKLAFSQFGARHGLGCIPSGLNPDDVGQGPYVVKERFGAGSRMIGLNLSREDALKHSASLKQPIFQPYISGREISVDAWLDRSHQVKGLVMRSRDQVVNGESQVTTTFRHSGFEAEIMQVLHALNLSGPVVLQALIDSDSKLHVIECNARFGGASTTSIAAGLDSFYWTLLECYGADVKDYPFDRIPGEIRQVRVPSDIHLHAHNL